jgi:ectoine hydroxylase-related dioxygenase (phytanoyl-CoA dioxygenase family)
LNNKSAAVLAMVKTLPWFQNHVLAKAENGTKVGIIAKALHSNVPL